MGHFSSSRNKPMDIERALLKEHSKAQILKIVRWIGTDPERLGCLMTLFFTGEPIAVQRGAWVIGTIADTHPELFIPWLGKLLPMVTKRGVHDAVKRNIVRLLQVIEIPDRLSGRVVSLCFDLLSSSDEPIAVKVYAMTVIARFTAAEPDLERELRLLIEMQLPRASGAFRSRAKKILEMKH